MTLSPNARRQIMAKSGVANATLTAYLETPHKVREVSRIRIEQAMIELGIAFANGPGPASLTGISKPQA